MSLNFKQALCKLNPFYNYGTIKPTKMVLHSTGCNNPNLSRWTNSWNSKTARNSVHGVIGKDEDGNVDFVQLLPFTKKAAGVGKGSKGSYNSCAIQVEIAEDDLKDKEYFTDCYNKAVEVFAEICKEYKIDSDDIVCHCEAHKLGYGSNHADVMHWFPTFGKSMDTFRSDVNIAMNTENKNDTTETTNTKVGSKVIDVQKWLNKYYIDIIKPVTGKLAEDNKAGKLTKTALILSLKSEFNKLDNYKLKLDNVTIAEKTKDGINKYATIRKGDKGIFVTIFQALLVCNGYDPNGIDGIAGTGFDTATKKYQKDKKNTQDSIAGIGTWTKILTL